MNRENLIIKKLLTIETLLRDSSVNESLKEEISELKKQNTILKGQLTKLRKK